MHLSLQMCDVSTYVQELGHFQLGKQFCKCRRKRRMFRLDEPYSHFRLSIRRRVLDKHLSSLGNQADIFQNLF